MHNHRAELDLMTRNELIASGWYYETEVTRLRALLTEIADDMDAGTTPGPMVATGIRAKLGG